MSNALRILATATTAAIGGALVIPAVDSWRTAVGIFLIFIAGTVGAWIADRPHHNNRREADHAKPRT